MTARITTIAFAICAAIVPTAYAASQQPPAVVDAQPAVPADTLAPPPGETESGWVEPEAADSPSLALPLVLLVTAAAGGVAFVLYRRTVGARHQEDDHELPPLVFPMPRHREHMYHHQLNATHAAVGTLDYNAAAQGEAVQAGPILFHRPPEGTLQLLPGRLEILSGNEQQEEIRFIRVSGRDSVVTFGRSEGEPHLHIQLQSRTVSRLHAAMRFEDGRWHIANLSQTNPVVLNGRSIPAAGAGVALSDGDQIELGEVVFRFRSR